MEQKLQLNGFVFTLYRFFWLHNPFTNQKLKIYIPHIIEFKFGKPVIWLYSFKGQVLKKNELHTNMNQIKQKFSSQNQEIVASWIVIEEKNVSIQYISKDKLNSFLDEVISSELNGYLQSFIYPLSRQNSVIKCVWSDHLCLFEGFTNNFNIDDQRADMMQRVITFESISGPVITQGIKGQVLSEKLERLSRAIKKQQKEKLSLGMLVIKSMENYFKVDQKGEIYLIHCSQMKLTSQNVSRKIFETQENSQKKSIILSPNISLRFLTTFKPQNTNQQSKCPNCLEFKNQVEFKCVSIKEILSSVKKRNLNDSISKKNLYLDRKIKVYSQHSDQNEWKNRNLDSNSFEVLQSSFYEIPSLIKQLYPKMSKDHYETVKLDQVIIHNLQKQEFHNQQTSICFECYQKMCNDSRQILLKNNKQDSEVSKGSQNSSDIEYPSYRRDMKTKELLNPQIKRRGLIKKTLNQDFGQTEIQKSIVSKKSNSLSKILQSYTPKFKDYKKINNITNTSSNDSKNIKISQLSARKVYESPNQDYYMQKKSQK